jgi:dolichyl-diphosphooligosaccharide--protein glycosyltransferase
LAAASFDAIPSAADQKPGLGYIPTLSGWFLIGCTAFLVVSTIIMRVFSKAQLRNGLALLGGTIIAGIAIVSSGLISFPTFRYLNAANPFLITTDMLNDSVSEHATTTIDVSFYFFSILMVFAGIGAWLLFQKKVNRSLKIKGEMAAFALIIGFLGIYFSSAFVRLEVFGMISVIVLSSIGITILISKILKEEHKPTSTVTKISFLAIIVALLMVPMVYPEEHNWSNYSKGVPNTILNSGTQFLVSTNDWSDGMQWLKENTPEDAVVAAWWDYGYWVSTLAERKTLADNATLLDWQIRKIAAMYMSTPDHAWHILTSDTETDVSSYYVTLPTNVLHPTRHSDDVYDVNESKFDEFKAWKELDDVGRAQGQIKENKSRGITTIPGEIYDPDKISNYPTLFDYWEAEVYSIPPVLTGLDADYIVINLAVSKLSDDNLIDLYVLRQKGGDETKVYWFMKIADLRVLDYYNPELTGYSSKFWDETLLGKLIPFTHVLYVDPVNPEIQSETFKPGYTSIYVKDVKFPRDGNGPFQLVYVPPSFEMDAPGPLTGPLIYKINKEYNPNQ